MKCQLINGVIKENYVDTLLRQRGIANPNDYYMPREEFLQSPCDLENVGQGAMLLEEVIKLG